MRSLVLILLIAPTFGRAFTGDSTTYLLPGDTLELSISPFQEKIVHHYFEKGQTLYSLAKFYGLTAEELKYYNPGLEDGVKLGDQIEIPIPNKSIIRYPGEYFNYQQHIPLIYTIKKGDTMYGLSTRLFKMPMDEIRRRLMPMDTELKVGQHLFIGWIHIGGVPEEYRQLRGHPLFRLNQKLRGPFMAQAANSRKNIEQQGAAAWQDDEKTESEFLALHAKAPIGSILEIYNPMRKRVVYAKVVGRIPITVYDDNVIVVISALTAKLLGARNPEFYVKVKYYP